LIAADTSIVIAFLTEAPSPLTDRLAKAMEDEVLVLPPPVVAELRAGPGRDTAVDLILKKAPLLPLYDGFWERAGLTRRLLIDKGRKARMLDTLIAQCCLDADLPLIARDTDFSAFVEYCGLRLA